MYCMSIRGDKNSGSRNPPHVQIAFRNIYILIMWMVLLILGLATHETAAQCFACFNNEKCTILFLH